MLTSYRVVYGDANLLKKRGFNKVAHVPVIFDGRPGAHYLASEFLLERAMGAWDPMNRGRGMSGIPPTGSSIKTFGDRLCNFLEWADIRRIEPVKLEYVEHIFGRYQVEMQKGIWSMRGTPLSASTINARVDIACQYLSWLADKGYREPFNIPHTSHRFSTGSATSSVGHGTREVTGRNGKLRKKKRRIQMPKKDEVNVWLKRVYEDEGRPYGLMAELILNTAIRREEAACWRTDTLPQNPEDWHIPNREAPYGEQYILIDIKYGCKGKEFGEDRSDKIGPEGTIRLPLHMAEKILIYINRERPQALRKWVKAAGPNLAAQKKRREEAVHLFLDDKTGERISARALYTAWTNVDLPIKGWCPHLGRDFWACSVLLKEIEKHEYLLSNKLESTLDLIKSSLMAVIQLVIQPQLRHRNLETSLIYLQWAADLIGFDLGIQYEAELEESDQNDAHSTK